MKKPASSAMVCVLAGAVLAATGGHAHGQFLGGGLGNGLGGAVGGLTAPLERAPPAAAAGLTGASDQIRSTAVAELQKARRLAAQELIRRRPEAIDADEQQNPVVRGEVLALAPAPQALAAASRAGFRILARSPEPALGLDLVTLAAPDGLSTREAVRRLRALDPQGQYDYDHIYLESGALGPVARAGDGGATPRARGVRLGLVDGAVAADHPAFRGVKLEQAAFGPGGTRVTAHATAVASLLAGADGRFRGAAPGANLWVADVYGPTPAGGSAGAIVRGLEWLAENRVGVINVSLVGPPNLALAAAVRSLVARGSLLVAAVGNDGPAAPPLYPAAYPGVVAVTAVDPRRRVLPEAGRGPYVSFAAPGAEMAAASPTGGYVSVRGTSFAAPIVAGELAPDLPAPDPEAARHALSKLAAEAVDLGARGRDPVFGIGLVGFDLRTDPAQVGARGLALSGP